MRLWKRKDKRKWYLSCKEWRRDPMDSTIRSNIKIGQTVKVIQKQDQRTGKQTEWVVERILTNSSNHPRGIKVKLEGGIVGRVCEIKG